jgi:hypothetical protein
MKQILTYFFYLIVLICLTLFFDLFLISILKINTGFVFLLLKTYVLTDSIACLSLLLFFMKSTYQSLGRIIFINTFCFVLVSLFGLIGSYATVWYSNIPEEVMLLQQVGAQVNLVNSLAAFLTTTIFALVLILMRSKNR